MIRHFYFLYRGNISEVNYTWYSSPQLLGLLFISTTLIVSMRCTKLTSSLNYISIIAIHETWNVHATSILYGSWLILNTTRNHQRSIHVCLKVDQNGGIQKLADETKCKPDTINRDRLNPTKCHKSWCFQWKPTDSEVSHDKT